MSKKHWTKIKHLVPIHVKYTFTHVCQHSKTILITTGRVPMMGKSTVELIWAPWRRELPNMFAAQSSPWQRSQDITIHSHFMNDIKSSSLVRMSSFAWSRNFDVFEQNNHSSPILRVALLRVQAEWSLVLKNTFSPSSFPQIPVLFQSHAPTCISTSCAPQSNASCASRARLGMLHSTPSRSSTVGLVVMPQKMPVGKYVRHSSCMKASVPEHFSSCSMHTTHVLTSWIYQTSTCIMATACALLRTCATYDWIQLWITIDSSLTSFSLLRKIHGLQYPAGERLRLKTKDWRRRSNSMLLKLIVICLPVKQIHCI